jgi:hypothetical protein
MNDYSDLSKDAGRFTRVHAQAFKDLQDERDMFKRTLDKRDVELAMAQEVSRVAVAENRKFREVLSQQTVDSETLLCGMEGQCGLKQRRCSILIWS